MTRALEGKRVLLTRAVEQSDESAALVRGRGAEPVVVPTIAIHPPRDPDAVKSALHRLDAYAWVAFTSKNGVEFTWRALADAGLGGEIFERPGAPKVAVVGPLTARALAAHGIVADTVAKDTRGEGLAEAMLARGAGGTRVLVLRAEVAREIFPETLRAAGCIVDVVAVYHTEPPPRSTVARLALDLEERRIDVVTFTSSSTATNLCDLLGAAAPALLGTACVASIGPITTRTCEDRGIRVDVTANPNTLAALLDAVEAHLDAHPPTHAPAPGEPDNSR